MEQKVVDKYVGGLNKDKELNRGRVVQLENYAKMEMWKILSTSR